MNSKLTYSVCITIVIDYEREHPTRGACIPAFSTCRRPNGAAFDMAIVPGSSVGDRLARHQLDVADCIERRHWSRRCVPGINADKLQVPNIFCAGAGLCRPLVDNS